MGRVAGFIANHTCQHSLVAVAKKKKKITVPGFAKKDKACQAVMHLCSLTQDWEGLSSKLPTWIRGSIDMTVHLENVITKKLKKLVPASLKRKNHLRWGVRTQV